MIGLTFGDFAYNTLPYPGTTIHPTLNKWISHLSWRLRRGDCQVASYIYFGPGGYRDRHRGYLLFSQRYLCLKMIYRSKGTLNVAVDVPFIEDTIITSFSLRIVYGEKNNRINWSFIASKSHIKTFPITVAHTAETIVNHALVKKKKLVSNINDGLSTCSRSSNTIKDRYFGLILGTCTRTTSK